MTMTKTSESVGVLWYVGMVCNPKAKSADDVGYAACWMPRDVKTAIKVLAIIIFLLSCRQLKEMKISTQQGSLTGAISQVTE